MATPNELNKFKIELDISEEDLKNSGLQLEVLYDIYNDYGAKYSQLVKHLNMLTENLSEILELEENVHSIKKRAKKPEALIRKIIKKSQDPTKKEKYSKIDKVNYLTIMPDVLGIRIVTLFATDWESVDELLGSNFNNDICVQGNKEAKIPLSKSPLKYQEKGFKAISNKDVEYFSLHYDYITKGFFGRTSLEIQVRPIYIEAWAEIDHKIRYKEVSEHEILDPYFNALAKMSLALDDLSTHAVVIKKKLETLERELNKLSVPDSEKVKVLGAVRKIFSADDLSPAFTFNHDYKMEPGLSQTKQALAEFNSPNVQNQIETLKRMKDQFPEI